MFATVKHHQARPFAGDLARALVGFVVHLEALVELLLAPDAVIVGL